MADRTLADVMSAIDTLTEAGILGVTSEGRIVLWPEDDEAAITPKCEAAVEHERDLMAEGFATISERIWAEAQHAIAVADSWPDEDVTIARTLDSIAADLATAASNLLGVAMELGYEPKCDCPDCIGQIEMGLDGE